jgi:DNA polymerase elongation subunit (family B)
MYKNIYIDSSDGEQIVYVWDDKQGLLTFNWGQFNYAYESNSQGKYITMTGVRVNKVRRFTRGAPNVFESDVPRETRVLTDLYLDDDTPSDGNISMFFDIEVSMENGVPNIDAPNNKITSIACYDDASKEYMVFVLDESGKYTNQSKNDATVEFYTSELDLLYAFINYYEGVSPNILTGWNINKFDVPYLYNRMSQLCGKNTAGRLSPIGKVRYSEFREQYVIAGVSMLDYLDLYKKFTYTQQQNYRLDTIGRLEVGMGKVEYEGSLDMLFEQDLEKFIEYNLTDVKIVVSLDQKLQLIELVRGICHVGHVPYEDYAYSSRFLEGTIITYLHRKGIIVTDKAPNAREMMQEREDEDEEGFAGAYVKPPKPGVYDWVYSLDLQSLYPSIIMSLNISPETKVGKIVDWDRDKLKDDFTTFDIVEKSGVTRVSRDELYKLIEDEMLTISSNGILYTNAKRGIIPEVLEVWFAQRKEFKDLMKKYTNEGDTKLADFYNRRQHIQKIFLNSLYGVLGLPIFRFFDIDNALAVTASGQDVIKNSADFVNNLYISQLKKRADAADEDYTEQDYCIYIDTDSLYFSAKQMFTTQETDEEKKVFTIKLAGTVEKLLNSYYDGFAMQYFFCENHKFYIKGESIAKTGVWIAKKRYALDKVYDLETNEDMSKIKVTGLDVVRSSFPTAFRDFMNGFLKDILRRTDKSVVDSKVLDFKKTLPNQSFIDIARNTSVKQLSKFDNKQSSISTFKKGTPIHVKAAIAYNRLLAYYNLEKKYEKIEDGAKVKYVYLKDNPLKLDSLAVKGYNDPKEIIDFINQYIDYDTLFENELSSKLEDFYSALAWGPIPTKVNQNANNWFSF